MEAFQWLFLLLAVIAGFGMLFASCRGNRELSKVSERYADEEEQRLAKKWEVLARWVPIRKQSLLLFAMFGLLAVNFHPAIMVLVLQAQLYQLRKELTDRCGNSLYLNEKKQSLEKGRKNAKYEKEAGRPFDAAVWEAVSPVYQRSKRICVSVTTLVVTLQFILRLTGMYG